ncbi:MAG: hypothetical protein FVQ81_03375 [Candidatus Glassbacteria bacterium]|nr:hypothetical protein [Candidatus Glassbacteria bacterium]
MNDQPKVHVEYGDDARTTPARVAYVKADTSLIVEREEGEEVMTFPHLVVREVLAFEVLMIVLAICSLIFDAPLESIADPEHSPNPAKAPWYFLGLQELLHYFPPIVAGVVLPGLVVVCLVVIPYFKINLIREPFWTGDLKKKFTLLSVAVLIINIPFLLSAAVPIYICSLLIYSLMLLPIVLPHKTGISAGLKRLALADWIMIWFVLVGTVLTVIGVFFRGPEWRWVWPWFDGIYY